MTENGLNLSPAEKKALKAQAHGLDPVVLIGDKGLTDAVMKEIHNALSAHGLIKVRVTGDERETRLQYAQEITETTESALVQHIGKLLVLFRPKPEGSDDSKPGRSNNKPKPKRTTKRQLNSKD